MHLYFMTRGNYYRVFRFVQDCLARYYKYEYMPGKDGILQLSMRPMQLWESVFPDSALDDVLNFIWPYNPAGAKTAALLRRWMQLEKIPAMDASKNPHYPLVGARSVSVTGIGIKKDERIHNIEQI